MQNQLRWYLITGEITLNQFLGSNCSSGKALAVAAAVNIKYYWPEPKNES